MIETGPVRGMLMGRMDFNAGTGDLGQQQAKPLQGRLSQGAVCKQTHVPSTVAAILSGAVSQLRAVMLSSSTDALPEPAVWPQQTVCPRDDGANLPVLAKGTAPVPRSRQFDVLRILFATFVILSHAFEITDGNQGREPLSRWTHLDLTFGALAVDGFFLLSGYLIVRSWQRHPNLREFLTNRILRIVPGFVVAFLLSTLFAGLVAPGVDHFFHHLGRRFLVSLLLFDSPMTPPVFPGIPPGVSSVNGSMWTIPYEVRCYLLVAVCGSLSIFRRRGAWLAGSAILLAASLFPRVPTHAPWYAYIPTGDPFIAFRLAFAFATGGCFYLYRDRPLYKPVLMVLALVGLVLVAWLAPEHLEPAVALLGGYLMFYFCSRPSRMINALPRFPDISYGLYLYAWPVESFLIWHFRWSPWFIFFVATAVCVVLSWLSWHLVEEPMLKFKHPSRFRMC